MVEIGLAMRLLFCSGVNSPPFTESPGPVKAQIANRMPASSEGMAAREKQMEVRGDLEETP